MLNLKHNPAAHDAVFRSVLAFPLSGLDEVVQRVAATRVPTLLIWALYDRVLPFEPHYGRWKALLRTGACRGVFCQPGCRSNPTPGLNSNAPPRNASSPRYRRQRAV